MRLTVDLRMYRHSGIGRYLRNLFPLLLPQLNATRVRVLGARELFQQDAWTSDPRVEIFHTDAPIYGVPEQMLGLRGAYKDSDLLWVPHYNGPLYYSGRLVATIHDIAPIAVPQILDSTLKRAYASLLIRRTVSQAAAVLCVSEFSKRELETYLHAPSSRILVTPLGLDADWPTSAERHVEADGVPYLLFVGNVKPNKNLRLLLQAMVELRERVPYRLLVVGRTHGFSTGDSSVDELLAALGTKVRLTGEVSDGELQELYSGAAALVVPSIYEGFGLTLLEAMQLGCPVVSSTAGSLNEVGGDAALYFDPHSVEGLVECLLEVTSCGTMKRLTELGYKRVEQFSFVQCAEQTGGVLNGLMVSG